MAAKFLILLLLITGVASAQVMQSNNTPGGYKFTALKADTMLIIPSGVDTPLISNPKFLTATDGALFLRTGDSSLWGKIGNRFRRITGAGGGGSTGLFGNDTATLVIAKVHNNAGVTLVNGDVVYMNNGGNNSDAPSVRKAVNKGDSTSANTFGFVTGSIAVNDTGYIILSGKIEKLNTSAFNNGDIIYLDSIAGKYTTSKPKAPYHLVYLGVVVKSNNGNGSIFVKVQNGYELDEIHDVQINSVANGQILVYSDTLKIWKNRAADYWGLTGNSGTTSSNFIGTTDSRSLRFRTNNIERVILDSTGRLGIGTSTPEQKVHIVSNTDQIKIESNSNTGFASFSMTGLNTKTFNFGVGSYGAGITAWRGKFGIGYSPASPNVALTIDSANNVQFIDTITSNLVVNMQGSGGTGTGIRSSVTNNDSYAIIAAKAGAGSLWEMAAHGSTATFLPNGFSITGGSTAMLNINSSGGVAIGNGLTTANLSAILDLTNTTRGFLPPRLTATQRNAIATPAAGLMVYDTDSSRYMLYGSSWKGLAYTDAGGGGGGGSTTSASGTGISLVNGSSLVKRLKAGFNTIVTDNTDSVTISRDTLTQTLTDGATVTYDATAGVSARVTLAGNRTLSITNMNNGMYLTLVVIQDGTGGRTLTLPAGTRVVNGGAGAVSLSSAANARDILTFFEIGDVIYCNVGRNYN